LGQLAHYIGAGRIGQLAELAQMLIDRAFGAGPLERCPDEDRAIHGGRDDDRLSTDGYVLEKSY
jgi:hypothetical protein